MNRCIRLGLFLSGLFCLALFAQAARADGLPGDSVYHLHVPLLDQDAHPVDFASLRGKPRLVTMFYASCPYMCPLIIDT
ncbi:MAG: SCO family protein, partial [Dokdonella sp.]